MTDVVVRLEIRGVVQGVGFRWSMAQAAGQLGVRGWVRNRRAGWVEAIVAGAKDRVDQMIVWARKGPDSAAVSSVEVFTAEGVFDSFEQRPTVT